MVGGQENPKRGIQAGGGLDPVGTAGDRCPGDVDAVGGGPAGAGHKVLLAIFRIGSGRELNSVTLAVAVIVVRGDQGDDRAA